jgi:tetratricopeptide (TPR) repeat protein
MKLSVAMIVKNEVETLKATVESVSKHVDEIVIGIDEASSDGTKKLAKKLASKVIPIYLTEELEKGGPRDDTTTDWGFSAARNLVFDACTPGSWRLILDGHELVKNPSKIRRLVNSVSKVGGDAIMLPVYFEPDNDGIPQLAYKQGRLLGPEVRYTKSIHNLPQFKNKHVSEEIIIEHCKKHQNKKSRSERNTQRSSVNIDSLKKKVASNPKDARSMFYLGQAYRENQQWEEAINIFSLCLTVSVWNEERWHARYDMARCYRAINDFDNARSQYSQCLEEFAPMAEAYFCLGDMAYKQQRFQEARIWLEKCVELPMPDCNLFVTPMVYMFNRHDALSMVYNHYGEYKKAIEQGEIALKAKKDERVKKNVRVWKEHLNPPKKKKPAKKAPAKKKPVKKAPAKKKKK